MVQFKLQHGVHVSKKQETPQKLNSCVLKQKCLSIKKIMRVLRGEVEERVER